MKASIICLMVILGVCIASDSLLKIEDHRGRYMITLKSHCHHDNIEATLQSTIEGEYGMYLEHYNMYIVKTPKIKIGEAVESGSSIHPSGLTLTDCIEKVEEDTLVTLEETPTTIETSIVGLESEDSASDVHSEFNVWYAWHRDRINAHSGFDHDSERHFSTTNASHVYIVDSGIDRHHLWLADKCAPDDSSHHVAFSDSDTCGFYACDQNTHGTHVSGLVASNVYGYNNNATLHAVKVFNASGSTTNAVIFSALNWVIANRDTSLPASVNMSLGGGFSSSLNQASAALISNGIHTLVAAGNESGDACQKSPASTPSVMTIGSTNNTDAMSWFSNYGSCVDIYAPGENILSTLPNNYVGYKSGTSMATPVALGLVSAVAASHADFFNDPAAVQEAINNIANAGIVTGTPSGLNNNLIYDGYSYSESSAVAADIEQVELKAAEQSSSFSFSYLLVGMCLTGVIAFFVDKKRNRRSNEVLLSEETYGKMI